MARTNLESDFWDRCDVLAENMGWAPETSYGAVAKLYKRTQALKKTHCSAKEIELTLSSKLKKFRSVFVENLLASRLISDSDLTENCQKMFEIRGNRKQLNSLQAFEQRAIGAANKRWDKHAPSIKSQMLDAQPTPMLVAHANSIQFNSRQFNSDRRIDITPRSAPLTPPSAESPTPKTKQKFSEDDTQIATEWAEWAQGSSKTVRPNLPHWAEVFRKIREIDGVKIEELRNMLQFVRSDEFWGPNAISADRLRQRSKSNGLLKHENIRASMKPPTAKKPGNGLDEQYWADLEERERNGLTGL